MQYPTPLRGAILDNYWAQIQSHCWEEPYQQHTARTDRKNEEWMYQLDTAGQNVSHVSKLLSVYETQGATAAYNTYRSLEADLPEESKEALASFVAALRQGLLVESRSAK
eukprot:TRINITY_DN16661_c0_g1_i1.p1 TRINITY_DN16661_c0_g1~~TRINITY_DN16661_c0_g1_i1.p1  ORF type:complete len:110 (+),score=6.67 TRINITY_DN16661_c0_g1_i1:65-394(+)